MKELAKTYSPASFEDEIYRRWNERGYFKPSGKGEPFTIVIPPPNVTGQLHMGHALDETLQDILVRYKRMQGYRYALGPRHRPRGHRHADQGRGTPAREGGHRPATTSGARSSSNASGHGRRSTATASSNQLKKLGSSCDWQRERFTMDEGCSKAVREVFVSLYEKGLIYRGNRIINWCPKCRPRFRTPRSNMRSRPVISGISAIRSRVRTAMLIVATTRPETLLGDTAVAVNPKDERYTKLVGKTLILPLVGREIPVIADEYVEKEFGTGVVKITPAHDPNDFLVGQRHDWR